MKWCLYLRLFSSHVTTTGVRAASGSSCSLALTCAGCLLVVVIDSKTFYQACSMLSPCFFLRWVSTRTCERKEATSTRAQRHLFSPQSFQQSLLEGSLPTIKFSTNMNLILKQGFPPLFKCLKFSGVKMGVSERTRYSFSGTLPWDSFCTLLPAGHCRLNANLVVWLHWGSVRVDAVVILTLI